MYGKLFASMYDGTLRQNWEALVTFQQLIVLADVNGVVDITAESLSARTGIPFDIIERGLQQLEQPDGNSRTPDEEGRRIVRVSDHRNWGWRITNYLKYRDLRTTADRREYMKQYMRQRREQERVNRKANDDLTEVNGKPTLAKLAEAEAEVDKRNPPTPRKRGEASAEGFAEFYGPYPRKQDRQSAERAWNKLKPDPDLRAKINAAVALQAKSEQWRRGIIPLAATWLNGRRWEDEMPTPASGVVMRGGQATLGGFVC